jgi:ATP-dependent DNA helicase RecG
MKPCLNKLQKFFKLESERGYDNKAVMGGLASMLETWESEARAEDIQEELIQAVKSRLRDYHRLSETSRKEALHGLWNRITRDISEPHEKLEPQLVSEEAKPEVGEKPEASKTEPTSLPKDEPEVVSEPVKSEPTRKPPHSIATAALGADVSVLPGVGPRHANTLGRLGLSTLGDMLYHFPRRYDDYSKLKPINRLDYGDEVTIIGTVQSITSRTVRGGKAKIVRAVVSDGSGALSVTWFNQPWIAQKLKPESPIVLSGKVDIYLGRLTMNSPEWEPLEQKNLHTNRIVPVYPSSARITQRWLRKLMNQVVTYWAPRVQDPLPKSIRKSAKLMDLSSALLQIHFPSTMESLRSARHRLAFDEIFLLQMGVLNQKRTWKERSARSFTMPEGWMDSQISRLPFSLTEAQKGALSDVIQDLESGHPMNRLLQGDVGSGKTVIAAMAIAIVSHSGSQTALMAPTSILAEQHFNNLREILSGEGGLLDENKIRLMIGSTPETEKQGIREALTRNEVKVIIGTHALLEGPVNFADLQLAIIDEQHRFGVKQRGTLRAKGTNPHLLVMTATPIPRSLSLTVYGDLDLSLIDEMPPGRSPVETHVLYPKERERAYGLVRSQVEEGYQAFIIYPLVEESDKSEEKAAVEEYDRLRKEIFPRHNLGLLHGRLKPTEKEEVMKQFRDGELQILVSTSVVEVGVDIPNATVMIVDGAHRFGLAQLHQFRGRVGRGQIKSYCLLIPSNADAVENERLQAMVETTDGFVLAERDLEHRGPGDFLGTRQSGYSDLRLASLTNIRLIEKARRHAQIIFNNDPELNLPEHQFLATTLERFWTRGEGDIS